MKTLGAGLLTALVFLLMTTGVAATEFDPVEATNEYLAAVTPEDAANTDGYVNANYGITLLDTVLTIALAWLLLSLGWTQKWRDLAERVFKRKFLQAFVYVPLYLVITSVILFPLTWYGGYFTEHRFGLSEQALGDWLIEALQGVGIAALGLSLFVGTLYLVLRKFPQRWWLWGTGLTGGFLALLLFISPLYIDPVFNEYRPMDEGPLKERILSMARANGMQADDVKQVDASKQTTRVSANVSGLFGSSRIALNDNLLLRASPDAVEAVMGHEIAHYVLNHQWKMITYLLLIIGACFALSNALFKAITRRWGDAWAIRGIDDYAAFPLLYAVFSSLIFLATPMIYHVVYTQEYEADLFAINATQNPDAWAEVALLTAEYRKLHPPAWEESLLNHHPSPYVRIYTGMRWKAENLPTPTVGTSGQPDAPAADPIDPTQADTH